MAKKIIESLFRKFGYSQTKDEIYSPGSVNRPVGIFKSLMEDLKYRGLICHSIIDIGAHKCKWSYMAKSVFNDSKILLVEPQVELEYFLRDFCEVNPESKYEIVGVGSKNETKLFTVWPDFAGSSFLPKVNSDLNQREVNIIKIDDLIAENNWALPQIIKLDIQGYELEALKGAESTFGITEVYIMEVSFFPFKDVPGCPVFSDVINFMLERNYVVYDFGSFLRRPFDGALGQCDICFVKKDGFLRTYNGWN